MAKTENPFLKTPVSGPVPNLKRPVPGRLSELNEWAFSFKYFRQADYFGLSSINASWTISLLERLQNFSSENKVDFFRDAVKKDSVRYHEIDWEGKGVKISRNFFDWLPKDILENEEEFPFIQFHISKALGRVVGFWNVDSSLFYIIVLDPLHNIQPSKYSSYKMTETTQLNNEYSSLLIQFDQVRFKKCQHNECEVTDAIKKIPNPLKDINFFYFGIDDDYLESLTEQLKTKSLKEIIELGIIANM